MYLKIFIVIIAFSASLEMSAQGKKNTKKKVVTVKQTTSLFSGDYEGAQQGKTVSISLKANGNSLMGSLLMNGENAKITGTAVSNQASGTIKEDESGKTYAFTAERKANELYFNITFPEYNNQILQLVMQKQITNNQLATNKSIDQKLIGTWRNTEIISSGSGQFYSSFSTDYFLKFNADGTASAWSGKSAGGTRDVTIDANGNGNAQKMEWYTAGKNLYFVNPQNKKQSAVIYYAEPNLMMLTQNTDKKVYHRVN